MAKDFILENSVEGELIEESNVHREVEIESPHGNEACSAKEQPTSNAMWNSRIIIFIIFS